MRKKRLYRLGTCVVDDAFFHFHSLFKDLGYDVVQNSYTRAATSVFSNLLDKPGPMAERLHDEMHSTMQKNVTKRNWRESHYAVWLQYNAIVRLHSIDTLFPDVGPDDVLIMDCHGDLYSKYDDGKDSFGIYPAWPQITQHFPSWLVEKINTFPTYKADMISMEQVKRRHSKLQAFAELIFKKFNNNVIILDKAFTNKLYVEDLGPGEQLSCNLLNVEIPFITVDEKGFETQVNLPYLHRLYDGYARAVKRARPYWRFVSFENDACYADPNHRFGPHPTHLHPTSWEQLRMQFISALTELSNQVNIVEDEDHPMIVVNY